MHPSLWGTGRNHQPVFIDHNQDNEALDPMTRQLVMERDRERLRKMTFYCFTHECLRDYILRYFGEYAVITAEIVLIVSHSLKIPI